MKEGLFNQIFFIFDLNDSSVVCLYLLTIVDDDDDDDFILVTDFLQVEKVLM